MFQAMLREVVDGTDGAIAGLLMGFDGITVDSYTRDEGSLGAEGLEALGSEYSQILGQIKQAVVALELGEAREVAVSAENMTTVIRLLNESYFIALALSPTGNLGKGRYLLRVNAHKLVESLT
jgi:predicted regulator of Ras-like GTPase activity (Roadblock/LC7/MglB family)